MLTCISIFHHRLPCTCCLVLTPWLGHMNMVSRWWRMTHKLKLLSGSIPGKTSLQLTALRVRLWTFLVFITHFCDIKSLWVNPLFHPCQELRKESDPTGVPSWFVFPPSVSHFSPPPQVMGEVGGTQATPSKPCGLCATLMSSLGVLVSLAGEESTWARSRWAYI